MGGKLSSAASGESCKILAGDSCGYVIFGASGDLTYRKLIPAVFSLFRAGTVPKTFFVIGFARSKMDDRAFRERVKNSIQHAYLRLKARMEDLRTKFNTGGNLVFHVATPPSLYATIVSFLGHLSDEQIYRIDHYLGKETVQNILMFDGVVKTLHLLRCCKITIIPTYSSTLK